MSSYHSSSHCKYLLQYHIIWCPKFKFSVLNGMIELSLKDIIQEICRDYNYIVKAIEVMPDHIHLCLNIPQTVAPSDMVRTLKSISAIKLFKKFPELKSFYSRCGSLWSRGYFISTVGNISEDVVLNYIRSQKYESK